MRTNVTVMTRSPEEQQKVNEILGLVRQEFPDIKIGATAESKKLLPEEIILLIAVQVSSELIIRVLDRLWHYLKDRNVDVNLVSADRVQEKAENYLVHKGLHDFSIVKEEDKGLYVILIYRTRGHTHSFHISKTDLAILKYEEKT